MGSLGIVGVKAPRKDVLGAFSRATARKEALELDQLANQDLMQNRLGEWMDRLVAERIDAYVIGVSSCGDWTLLEDVQMVLPVEADILRLISSELHVLVAALMIQTTSNSFGLVVCENDMVKRRFMSIDGEIQEDLGELENEDPKLSIDPWKGVERAWERIVPQGELNEFEVRVFSNEPVSRKQPVRKVKRPWWKFW